MRELSIEDSMPPPTEVEDRKVTIEAHILDLFKELPVERQIPLFEELQEFLADDDDDDDDE